MSIFQRLQLRRDMLWKAQWSVRERMWTGARAWPGMNLHGITQLLPHQLVDHLIMDLCSEGTEVKCKGQGPTHSTGLPPVFPSPPSTDGSGAPTLCQACAHPRLCNLVHMKTAREDGLHCLRMPLCGFLVCLFFFFNFQRHCAATLCAECAYFAGGISALKSHVTYS